MSTNVKAITRQPMKSKATAATSVKTKVVGDVFLVKSLAFDYKMLMTLTKETCMFSRIPSDSHIAFLSDRVNNVTTPAGLLQKGGRKISVERYVMQAFDGVQELIEILVRLQVNDKRLVDYCDFVRELHLQPSPHDALGHAIAVVNSFRTIDSDMYKTAFEQSSVVDAVEVMLEGVKPLLQHVALLETHDVLLQAYVSIVLK